VKGMRKIRRGKNFAGVVQYALKPGAHHKCDPVVIGGNMLGDTAHEMIAEFDSTKHLRQDVAKPVWHNSLRLPDGETLSNDQWANIADDYMKSLSEGLVVLTLISVSAISRYLRCWYQNQSNRRHHQLYHHSLVYVDRSE